MLQIRVIHSQLKRFHVTQFYFIKLLFLHFLKSLIYSRISIKYVDVFRAYFSNACSRFKKRKKNRLSDGMVDEYSLGLLRSIYA